MHPHVFRSRLGKERYIVEYQVRQTADGADIDIRCTGHVISTVLREPLIGDLRARGLPAPRSQVTPVDRIDNGRAAESSSASFRVTDRRSYACICAESTLCAALACARRDRLRTRCQDVSRPGVSDTEIKIGQTMPYSGPLSAYGAIGKAEAAYFEKINAEGGINGERSS